MSTRMLPRSAMSGRDSVVWEGCFLNGWFLRYCSYECDARNLRAPAETSMTVIGLERLIISSGMSVSSSL